MLAHFKMNYIDSATYVYILVFLYFITTHINIIFIKKIIAGAKMKIATPTVIYTR